jgi:hypothetical protein
VKLGAPLGIVAGLVLLPDFGGVAIGQTPPGNALIVSVPRIEGAPRIDGILDDPIWSKAARITGFTEVEPTPGATPKDSTIGFVAYDRDYMYVAVVAQGRAGDRRASVTPRDNASIGEGDDGISLRLDTFNDKRRAYLLQVNPRGVQQDGTLLEGGEGRMSEDFVWNAAASLTGDGYVIEIAIPFTSLNFPHTSSFDIGFNIQRHYVLGTREDSWAPRTRESPCDICQEGVLTGFRDVATRRTVDLRPYVTGALANGRAFEDRVVSVNGESWPVAVPGAWLSTERERRAGADVRVAVTRSFELHATIKPDFSQIEASPEQVRVNRRFALYYDERRPFFTSGSSAFQTAGDGIGDVGNIFYSRNVVDPSLGGRLSGQEGKVSVAGLYAHDAAPSYFIYSGYESSEIDQSVPGTADLGSIRIKRNVHEDSYVGLMATRRNHGSGYNQVFGGDLRLRVGRITVIADGFDSKDQLPALYAPQTDQNECEDGYSSSGERCISDLYNGRSLSGYLVRSAIGFHDEGISAYLTAANVSDGFRDQLGTIDRVGVRRYGSSIELTQFARRFGLREVGEELQGSMTRGSDGKLLDYTLEPVLSVNWQQGTGIEVGPQFSHTTFLGEEFDTKTVGFSAGLRFAKGFWVEIESSVGDEIIYDFGAPRIGSGWSGSLSAVIRPIPGIMFNPSYHHVRTSERKGGPVVADADLLSIMLQYQRTPRLGFRWHSQFSDQASRLVENPFDQRDAYLRSSVLMSYELVSTSFLYVGVNDERRHFETPLVTRDRYVPTGLRAFLKATYLVRL